MTSPSARQAISQCWCANAQFLPYSDDYQLCASCGTLISRRSFTPDLAHVGDEQNDLYGVNYFFEHARELDHPDLGERAHLDLSQRCVHWLKALLEHRAPPAATLELGCSSGAFVAMLASAGYTATGQDLSPAVTALARSTFDVPVLTGPIEDQQLPEQGIDVLILMDVLEHLLDPVRTLGAGARSLREDGLLLIQTPCFDPALAHADLLRTNHAFLTQLRPDEHIFLYSRASVVALLRGLGFEHVEFLPAFFDMYDMFLLAARTPILRIDEKTWRQALRRSRQSRMIEALVDTFEDAQARIPLQHRLDQVEVDRARRLEVILAQQRDLARLRQDYEAVLRRLGPLRHLVLARSKSRQ